MRPAKMSTAVLVAHHYPPHIGGLGVVVQKQAESMADKGYQVVVLTSQYRDSPRVDSRWPRLDVIRVRCSHILENLLSIPFPLFSPGLLRQTWRHVKRADLVHIHDVFYMSSWIGGAAAILLRKPMFLTQHVALVDHSSRWVMLAQRLVYATLGRWLFSRARCIVAYNENVRAFLLSQGVPDSRILFLRNGIDTGQFRPALPDERAAIRQRFGLPQDRRLVLFVGRLVEKKGYHILLEARDPAYDLVFVGPGHVASEQRLPGVHWIGPLGQDETALLYRACDVFAFPAIGEIFTLVMQEAMACGLPVVTTDDPAYIGSMVSDAVVLCRRDSAAFRTAIADLLADTDRLARLGARSREVAVRHFDWDLNSARLLDAYSEVFQTASPGRE